MVIAADDSKANTKFFIFCLKMQISKGHLANPRSIFLEYIAPQMLSTEKNTKNSLY